MEKIVVNSGIGDAQQNSKGFEVAMKNMTTIIAQRPVKTVARESVASFKVREGNTLGLMATLRGKVYYILLNLHARFCMYVITQFELCNEASIDPILHTKSCHYAAITIKSASSYYLLLLT